MMNTFAFVIYPYLALTAFVVGHIYRYRSDRLTWNAKSSQFLETGTLPVGITLFHYGVILALLGHAGGLLIPQRIYDAMGISGHSHTLIAYYAGLLVGNPAFIGILLLLYRRVARTRIRVTTTMNDFTTLALLFLTVGTGLYNVLFGHYEVLYTVAPWLRGILTLTPDPELMRNVPPTYKTHIVSAFTLIGFAPFSRLIHIWSAPLSYLFRPLVVFRRRNVRA
jgi:nitrate reductase gamma subunit